MGENLVAGILKNIERMADVNIQQNVAILTSINKTNVILSREIGKELQKQTNLLKTIANALTKGEGASSSTSLFGKGTDTKGLAGIFKKGGAKTIDLLSSSIDKLTKSITEFAKAINEIDEKKFKLFTSLFDMGKKILLFSALIALSGPLLAIGLILTLPLLFLWVQFFNYVGKSSKKINKGIKMLMYMALATGIVALTVILTAYALGDPIKTLMAFALVAGSLLILAGAYFLVSLVSKPLSTGIKTMLYMALTTAILVAIVLIASRAMGDPMKTLIAFGLMAGSLLALAGAFYVISLVKGNILQGAIAMIIASLAVGILIFTIIQFSKANVTWEQIGMVGSLVVGLGLAMAAAGAAALFIGLGAGVMLLAGGALFIITAALTNFKEANWTESDSKNLTSSMSSIVTSFLEVFDNISITQMLKMMAGTILLGSIGNSLSSFAQGLSAFASAQAPVYDVKDGKLVLVGTKPITPDLGKKVGETIKQFLEPLVGENSVLAKLGAGQGFLFDGPVGNGIDLLARLGNSLSSFAQGLNAMAEFQVPEYSVENGKLVLVGTKPISPDFASKLGNSIAIMTDALILPMKALGENEGLFFDGAVGNGIDLLGRLGNSLGNFAQGVAAMAELQIPTYKVKDGELVLVGTKSLDKGFAKKVGENIKMITESLTKPLEELGSKDGWLFDSNYEDGLDMLAKLGEPIESLANAAKTLSSLDIDAKKLQNTVSGTINAFVNALSNESLKNVNEKQAKSVLDGFNIFSSAVEKMKGGETEKIGTMFVTIKDSINQMDLQKLNKLNDLASNLAKFAENMKGSFGELEDVLERLVDVVKEMNGIQVTTTNSPNTNSSKPIEQKFDLTPLINELDEIKQVLLSGIEVDVKDNKFSR